MRNALTIAACLALASCSTTRSSGNLSAIAGKYDGMHERADRAALTKRLGVDPVRVRWCGAFAGHVVTKAGHKPPTGHLKASRWVSFGHPVKTPRPGDIVVMRNHVTFYTRSSAGRICGIGGNQGNAVRESCYRAGGVLAFRRVK